MTDTPYNMPPLGLFGKRCRILTGYDKRPFVYRIVNSEWMSNTWCEPPITYQSARNPVKHDHSENILIVVLDTLIDENSRLIRVALKDVELMDEATDNAGWISVKDRLPENRSVYLTYSPKGKMRVAEAFLPSSLPGSKADPMDCWWSVHGAGGHHFVAVTHYMPLPEPPKEG